jgi:hypothetical protein
LRGRGSGIAVGKWVESVGVRALHRFCLHVGWLMLDGGKGEGGQYGTWSSAFIALDSVLVEHGVAAGGWSAHGLGFNGRRGREGLGVLPVQDVSRTRPSACGKQRVWTHCCMSSSLPPLCARKRFVTASASAPLVAALLRVAVLRLGEHSAGFPRTGVAVVGGLPQRLQCTAHA